MNKTLVLLRECPGSDKSTVAKKLGLPTFEADDYFMVDGEYKFDPSKLKDAHKSCQDRVEFVMEQGITKLAVANTFTEEWEMEHYYKLAEKYGYMVISLIVENRHDGKDIHNVPQESLNRMKNRFNIKL